MVNKRTETSKNGVSLLFKNWGLSLMLIPVTIYFSVNAGRFTFIDYVNLLIHEGGHGIFKVFGRFIYVLGGTLMQILIPTMFIVFYWIKKKKYLIQIFLVWLGENLINVSIYASDARARKLPLLGGSKVYHDWTYLLGNTGLLEFDYLVGQIFYVTGIMIFILSIVTPLFIKNETEQTIQRNISLDI